jgi:nitric oxide dioxygenase
MTPTELSLIEADAAVLDADPDRFARAFYATLFDLAPEVRPMFPADLADQRVKLMRELSELVHAGTGAAATGSLDGFVARAGALGRRHRGYGVTATMYAAVGTALVAAVRECVTGFDDAHAEAWAGLYRLVADAMREGALGA